LLKKDPTLKTNHQIVHGDSRQMDLIQDQSAHLVVTSPPYWQLKDYGTEDQIGFHESYEAYINNLNLVWQECYRILEPGCRLCVNIGDQFARAAYYGRYKVIPIRSEIIKCCEALGFDYMGAIIWQKQTTMNTSGGGSLMGSYPHPRNGVISIDYEFILLFKKLGKANPRSLKLKQQSALTKEEWKTYFSGHWHFGGSKQKGHIAMFPEELPHRLIKMFSFKGETIVDPFLGSGTTTIAAANLGRHSKSYEINDSFLPTISDKCTEGIKDPALCNIMFMEQNLHTDFTKNINQLPYQFKDFQNLTIKVDPKNNSFGSTIEKKKKVKRDYFRIKKILNYRTLLLTNGQTIQLIGITKRKGCEMEAQSFLEQKTNAQYIYVAYDPEVRSTNHIVKVYLYLKNKTFINAHLLKNKLVDAETSYSYKHKNKFIKLANHSQSSEANTTHLN